jgi:four helix bundle protein
VIAWNKFEKDTMGRQLTRAADSISANLSEAYGRFSIPDRKRFSYYARGSLCETQNWIEKSVSRHLIDPELGADLLASTRHLSMRLNAYIKSLDKLHAP